MRMDVTLSLDERSNLAIRIPDSKGTEEPSFIGVLERIPCHHCQAVDCVFSCENSARLATEDINRVVHNARITGFEAALLAVADCAVDGMNWLGTEAVPITDELEALETTLSKASASPIRYLELLSPDFSGESKIQDDDDEDFGEDESFTDLVNRLSTDELKHASVAIYENLVNDVSTGRPLSVEAIRDSIISAAEDLDMDEALSDIVDPNRSRVMI